MLPADTKLANEMIREITEIAVTPDEFKRYNVLRFATKDTSAGKELWTYLGARQFRRSINKWSQVYVVDNHYLAKIKNKTHVLCKAVGLDDGVDEIGEKRQRA